MKNQNFFLISIRAVFLMTVSLGLGACSQQFQVDAEGMANLGSRTPDTPAPPEVVPPPLNGAQLYANNCAACHGPLASSTKTGRSQTQIFSSIQSVPQMSGLKSLTSAEVQAITQALQPTVVGSCAPTNVLSQQVRRLTRTQMYNTLAQTFGTFIVDSDVPNLKDSNPRIGFASDPEILGVDSINFIDYHTGVKNIVTKVMAQNTTVKNCQTSASDTCFDSLIQDFGLKLWRRPLTTAEVKHLMDGQKAVLANGGSRSLRLSLVLTSLLMSPDYLYRTEIGVLDSGTSLYQLTPYEIASYISFSIVNSSPDQTLLDAAKNGKLSTTAEIKAQVSRLLQTPQWREGIAEFVVDYTKVADVLSATKDKSHGVSSVHRGPLFESAKMTVRDSYVTTKHNIASPFKTGRFFVNQWSNDYHNVPKTGLGHGLVPYNVDPTQRYGILTHPAFLFSVAGEVSSGIVKRGVYTLEQLLCEHLGAPPDEVSPVTTLPPGFDANKVSSREVLHITHSSQSSCIACHQKIDPAGYGFEHFDTLGKFRMFEKGTVAINAAGSLTTHKGETLKFNNSVDFVKELVESKTFQDCMEKKLFKYVTGQSFEEGAGVCESANLQKAMATKGKTVESLFDSLVELKSFRTRKPASK